ncbi:MAG: hypothetical protein AAF512_17700, partial [Pseudomonadota bacterium]
MLSMLGIVLLMFANDDLIWRIEYAFELLGMGAYPGKQPRYALEKQATDDSNIDEVISSVNALWKLVDY